MRPEDIKKVVLDLITNAVPRRFKSNIRAGLRLEMECQADLGIDSLALAGMIFGLEEKCHVRFNQEDLDGTVGQLRTVGDIVNTAVRLVTNAKPQGSA